MVGEQTGPLEALGPWASDARGAGTSFNLHAHRDERKQLLVSSASIGKDSKTSGCLSPLSHPREVWATQTASISAVVQGKVSLASMVSVEEFLHSLLNSISPFFSFHINRPNNNDKEIYN